MTRAQTWICFLRCLAPEGYVFWCRYEFPCFERDSLGSWEAAEKALGAQAGGSGIVEEIEVFSSGLGTRERWRVNHEALPETRYRFSLGPKL